MWDGLTMIVAKPKAGKSCLCSRAPYTSRRALHRGRDGAGSWAGSLWCFRRAGRAHQGAIAETGACGRLG